MNISELWLFIDIDEKNKEAIHKCIGDWGVCLRVYDVKVHIKASKEL